jgi:hypothetical protein
MKTMQQINEDIVATERKIGVWRSRLHPIDIPNLCAPQAGNYTYVECEEMLKHLECELLMLKAQRDELRGVE